MDSVSLCSAAAIKHQVADLFRAALALLSPAARDRLTDTASLCHDAIALAEAAWKRLNNIETPTARAIMRPEFSAQIDELLRAALRAKTAAPRALTPDQADDAPTVSEQISSMFQVALDLLAPDTIDNLSQMAVHMYEATQLALTAWQRLTGDEDAGTRAAPRPEMSALVDDILRRVPPTAV